MSNTTLTMLFGNLISDSSALFNHVERNLCDPHNFVLEFKAEKKALLDNLYVTRFLRNPRARPRQELQHLYIYSISLSNKKFDLDESSKLQSWRKWVRSF